MKKYIFAVLTLTLVAACKPPPTSAEDIDFEKLEGMQTECAKRATSAAMESFSVADPEAENTTARTAEHMCIS